MEGRAAEGASSSSPPSSPRTPGRAMAGHGHVATLHDLLQEERLDEESLLLTLQTRFRTDLIYTYIGEAVLVSINPYRHLEIYSDETMRRYVGRAIHDAEPHLYAVADLTLRSLARSKENQSLVVSGESGSGKTHAIQLMLKYYSSLPQQDERPAGGVDISRMAASLLHANRVLESFGNAKTASNDNSSRFGKLIKVYFSAPRRAGEPASISGAGIQQYLLEKQRVVHQSAGGQERGYHVFHQLLRGLDAEEISQLGLRPAAAYYRYLSAGTETVRGVDDAEDFSRLRQSLASLQVGEDEQRSLWMLVGACLCLGQVEFELDAQGPGGEAAAAVAAPGAGAARTGSSSQGLDSAVFTLEGRGEGATFVRLLRLPGGGAGLQDVLCSRQVSAGSERYSVPLDAAAAASRRDSLARGLYLRLFQHVTLRCNASLAHAGAAGRHGGSESEGEGEGEDGEGSGAERLFIGVLDIFGFEVFEVNSLEQLCINYANEKLQYRFIEHIIKAEQAEYAAEGLEWSSIPFSDNVECVRLIEGKLGLLSLIEEETVFPRATDDSLVEKLDAHFAPHAHFEACSKTGGGRRSFVVKHYAADVTYDATGERSKHARHPPRARDAPPAPRGPDPPGS